MKHSVLFGVFFAWRLFAVTPDPIGQTAFYELDTDPARTSTLIKSGTIATQITKKVVTSKGPAFELRSDYVYQLKLMGTKQGSDTSLIDASYFEPTFLEDLRKTGYYEGPNFKAKHLGFADAKTKNGKFYSHCDKVFLYDLKEDSPLWGMVSELFDFGRGKVEDATVLVHIFPGVPVLGGVKLDASGNYEGLKVKAGGDYVR
jgi:hypothetical protein